MEYDDKRYWLEEILLVLGVMKEKATTVEDVDEYVSMICAIEAVLDDQHRLENLEK